LAFGGDPSPTDALPALVTKGLAPGFATTSGDDIFNFRMCFHIVPRTCVTLASIRGFSYSKTDSICTLFGWIMHVFLLATLQHDISGYKASDGFLDLEFVADRSESSLACMEALAW
jgi:hypothetical protein